MKKITIFFIFLYSISGFSQAITVTPANTTTNSVQYIVEEILIDSDCAQVSNFQTQGLCGVGNFNYTGATTFFDGGMILRSGNVTNSSGEYSGSSMSTTCSSTGDAQLLAISQANGNTGTINDVSFVKFNFTPLTDSFSFNFVFASNEYGQFQCGFSDVFAFILTDLTTGVVTNLAVIPGTTTPVSVTNIRDAAYNTPGNTCLSVNPEYFDTYNVGAAPGASIMNMRGYTVPMTAFADVIPNNPYSIKLAIGDYNDAQFDSAVFIEAGSFNVGTANLSFPYGVDGEPTTSDMLISNGLAPCPNEIRTIDSGLNANNYVFEWTLDGVVIAGETGPTLQVSQPGTYCITADNSAGGGTCLQVDCIIVEYQAGFVINNSPNDLFSCTNDFDLSNNAATILNGLNPAEYDLLFFASQADALAGFPQIPSNQTTTQDVTTFYIAVENVGFQCRQFAQFDAVVSPCQPTQPADMIVCDDITNNGLETFDLTSQNAAILNGLSASDFTITYHTTLIGAQTETNLANPQNAYIGGPNQTIYVRFENNANPTQFETTTFQLIVLPLPTAAIGTSTICEGQSGVVTFSGTPGATINYTVNDGTGAVAQTPIVLDATGNASISTPVLVTDATYALVDVTSIDNCVRSVNGTATVTVLPLPDVTISTTTPSICNGNIATIDFVGTPNATVSYTVNGVAASINLNASGNASVTTSTAATYCLVSAISNTSPTCSQNFTDCVTITVIPLPTATITANTTCSGSTGEVTITGTPNATVNYTVDGFAATPVVLNASGTATITSPVLMANSVYCLVDITSACTQTLTACATISVLPLPTASISANTICSGSTGTVTITGTPNATVNYTVDGVAATPVVLNASGTATITSPVLTTNSVYCLVDVTSNTTPACTQTLTACATITVLPLPTASISANTICTGSTGEVTITGTPNATVNYTVGGVAATPVVLNASGTATITSPVLTTNSVYCLVDVTSSTTPACTQTLTACATITVLPSPTVAITGDTICAGDTAIVTFTGTPNALVNYTLNNGSTTLPGSVTLNPSGTATIATTTAGIYNLVDVTSSTTPSCTQSVVGSATVEVLTSPVANPVTEIRVCDSNNDGFGTFNLTSAVAQAQGSDATLTVTIHETQPDADFPSNALTASEILAYQNIVANTQTLYIRIENAGGCYITTTFNIAVDARPTLNQNVADYALCDNNNAGDGIEVFDLTNAITTANITNGVAGLTLSYYESLADAQVPQNAIANPTAYANTISPNQQTIWVVGQNAAGCTHITSFDIIVNPLPAITLLNPMNGCSDGVNPNEAPFNLTLNNPIVTAGAPGYTVSYHETQAQADDLTAVTLPTPYIGTDGQIVIVRVINNATGCYTTTTLQLNVTQGPVANTPTPLTYCDPNNDGFGTFNLEDALNDISGGATPTGVTITFHETPQDAQLGTNAITNITAYNNIVENQQTIYVRVSYDLTNCSNFTQLTLVVNPTPEIVSPTNPVAICDDATADGFTQFDLTQVEPEVLNGIDPTTVTISYYLSQADANAAQNAIVSSTNYTNISNPQTIYIRVAFTATGCYTVESFELVVNALPTMPAPQDITMSLCDDNNPGDEVEFFDLNSQIPTIINGQTNMLVSFYLTQADAIAGINPLTSPYQNTSNAQSIFVRLENGATGCFDTVIMDLRVEPLPVLVLPDPVEACGANQDGFAQFDLTALITDMLNGASGITVSFYETFTDASQQTNAILNPDTYQNIDAFAQILYVRAENDITGCFTIEQIQLIVHPSPIMPDLADIVICDTNYDGFAYFDLTTQNAAIIAANSISPLDIRYYTTALDAQNGTNAIVNPSNFYGGANQQTIWVVVKDPATGCSESTSFDLIINLPVDVRGQNNRLTLCDEALPNDQFTTFDLTVMDAQILGAAAATGATVVYYPSVTDAQNGTNAITNPTAYTNTTAAVQTLGVVVTSAQGCPTITTLTIRVEPLPTPKTDPPAIVTCDNDQTNIGTEIFDLTTYITYIQDGYPNLSFEYYPTQADAIAGTNEITNPTTYEGSGIIYIKVMNTRIDSFGENCYQLVAQELIVDPLPVVADTTFVLCDDDTDGMATFILSDYNAQLLGSTQLPADFTITYYDSQANAQAGTSIGLLATSYVGTNLEQIYPNVVNNATGCVNTLATVTLSVKLKAIANPISQTILETFTQCDYYNANDGVAMFDLTAVEADILGTQTTPPVHISYHLTPQDQASGDNPIANPSLYVNTSSPFTQIIYIRVARDNDDPLDTTVACYDVTEITLNVELLAEPLITSPSETICVDYNTGNLLSGLTLDSGIAAGSGYTYQWALDGVDITDGTGQGATYDITTAAPGIYSVVVTSTTPQACVSLPATFEVIQSGPAANVQYFVTGAFEDTQTITVVNDGYGVYLYQLDDGPILNNGGVFTNVTAGEHTVTIYDNQTANPCDAYTIQGVNVINYPHFFTPNGDGINDTWNITGLNTQTTAKIYIFDRYGKLLKQISAASEGWNGTLNGQPVPATDYWFTVEFYEISVNGEIIPKQFKAHFTLKR